PARVSWIMSTGAFMGSRECAPASRHTRARPPRVALPGRPLRQLRDDREKTTRASARPRRTASLAPLAMEDELHRIRHSLSHVLAQAVLQLRPGSTLGFGPPIADGFYYDFILSAPLSEEDFPEIEKRMRHIIKQRQE